MAVKTAQQALDAYQAAMSSAQTQANYRNGINSTTVNPMAKAAEPDALNRYAVACQNSVTSGFRAKQLMGANVATWKNNATTIGATRLSDGARKASAKLMAAYQRLQGAWVQMQQIGSDKTRGWQDRVVASIQVMIAAGKNAQGAA